MIMKRIRMSSIGLIFVTLSFFLLLTLIIPSMNVPYRIDAQQPQQQPQLQQPQQQPQSQQPQQQEQQQQQIPPGSSFSPNP